MKPLLFNSVVRLLWIGPLRRFRAEQPTVIAVTGSLGKTSAKDAIALVLGHSGRPTVKTVGNLGSDVGVALSLLGFTAQPHGREWLWALWKSLTYLAKKPDGKPYYVLEYSSDKPGDVAFLARKIAPDVGVITQVSPVHLQFFKNEQELIAEETALAGLLKPDGRLVTNADDPNQRGLLGSASVSLSEIQIAPTAVGLRFKRNGTWYQTSVLGEHQLYALLLAVAVGELEKIPGRHICSAVAAYQVPAGRGRLIAGKQGIRIIDDTYNSSPKAAVEALIMLRAAADGARSVAVLGRMNELGDEAAQLHAEVAAQATGLGLLVLVGEFAGVMTKAAVRAGQPLTKIVSFKTPEEAVESVPSLLQANDVVLVKGSQNGVRLERLVKEIMLEPERAGELLVRQGH